MAKNKRFPSDANKAKPGSEAASPKEKKEKPAVKGEAQATVQVHYKKDNHHVLGIGAHALRKGVNHLPAHVWEDAKKHPSVQSMIKSGDLACPADSEQEEEMEEQEEGDETDAADPEPKTDGEDKESEEDEDKK